MRLEVGQHVGNYQIESELGEGGMAVVYRAKHLVLHSAHAVKVLDDKLSRSEEIRQRFLAEARIQAGLRHPHITPVTDIIAQPGVAAIVMPYLSGEDLGQRLARQGAASVQEAVRWTLQALDALAFVHEQGIVHRDLKPSNLFLEQQPGGREVVRVMDFGIARHADSSLTRTAVTMGTPHYMSPEQIQSPRDVDARSDLFSMGGVLYELLTGQVAFDGDTDFQIQMRIVSGKYTLLREHLPSTNPKLSTVICRALEPDSESRFPNARTFAAALQEALQVTSNPPLPRPAKTPSASPPSRPERPAEIPPCAYTGHAISIDITGEGARVALWSDDGPQSLTDSLGGPYPLAVGLDGQGQLKTGHDALRQAITRPHETVTNLTALLGLEPAELEARLGAVGVSVRGAEIRLGRNHYTVLELIDLCLGGLRDTLSARRLWEAESGRDIAVLVIPSVLRLRDRVSLYQIGAFNIVRTLGPGVAAGWYTEEHTQDDAYKLFVHLGETSIDLAILEVGDCLCVVFGVSGALRCGQYTVASALEQDLIRQAEQLAPGVSRDPVSRSRLRDAATRSAPQALMGGTVPIDLPYLTSRAAPSVHLRATATARHVADALDEVADTVIMLVDRVLTYFDEQDRWAYLPPGELGQITLTGALAHQRSLQTRLMQKCARPVKTGGPVRELAVLGGLLLARFFSGEETDGLLLDALPLSLGIGIAGNEITPLIRRGSTYPLQRTEVFSTAAGNQSTVDIAVYEGEHRDVEKNQRVGTIRLSGIPPAPAGVPQIEVSLSIDSRGWLEVSARDLGSGRAVAAQLA